MTLSLVVSSLPSFLKLVDLDLCTFQLRKDVRTASTSWLSWTVLQQPQATSASLFSGLWTDESRAAGSHSSYIFVNFLKQFLTLFLVGCTHNCPHQHTSAPRHHPHPHQNWLLSLCLDLLTMIDSIRSNQNLRGENLCAKVLGIWRLRIYAFLSGCSTTYCY